MPVKEFFPLLREKKSPRLAEHWEDYLNHLAFAMKNLNLIIDAPIIISGYLAPYFTEEDIEYLTEHLHTAGQKSMSYTARRIQSDPLCPRV